MDPNLSKKLVDEHLRFLRSPTWALLKYRYKEYQTILRGHNENHIRHADWPLVSKIQGTIDCINDLIKITEKLGHEIQEGSLDVDAALSVIENK